MSDRQETGVRAALSLEEVFLSREFGSAPTRRVSSAGDTPDRVEPAQPAQLEQVFLSTVFVQRDALTTVTPAGPVLSEPVPVTTGRPTLLLLRGVPEGAPERDTTRDRSIAAVSSVAAAGLVVAGLAPGTGQPTVSARGHGPSWRIAGSLGTTTSAANNRGGGRPPYVRAGALR